MKPDDGLQPLRLTVVHERLYLPRGSCRALDSRNAMNMGACCQPAARAEYCSPRRKPRVSLPPISQLRSPGAPSRAGRAENKAGPASTAPGSRPGLATFRPFGPPTAPGSVLRGCGSLVAHIATSAMYAPPRNQRGVVQPRFSQPSEASGNSQRPASPSHRTFRDEIESHTRSGIPRPRRKASRKELSL